MNITKKTHAFLCFFILFLTFEYDKPKGVHELIIFQTLHMIKLTGASAVINSSDIGQSLHGL